jgi:hypothetical protein
MMTRLICLSISVLCSFALHAQQPLVVELDDSQKWLDSLAALDEEVHGTKGLRLWCSDMQGFAGTDATLEEAVRISYKSVFAERGGNGPKKQWEWQELGPTVQPEELNPGGRAIPAYAKGRGNGTGRINYIYPDPFTEGRVFACSPTGGLFVTTDNGANWTSAGTDQLPVTGVSSVVVNPEDPDHWVISTGDGDDRFMFSAGVWRTFDAGATWEPINGSGVGRSLLPTEVAEEHLHIPEITAHPCGFERLFAATNEGLWMSSNADEKAEKVKWKRLSTGFFYDVLVVPGNESVVLAGGEKLMVSLNCGNAWSEWPLPEYPNPESYTHTRMTFQPTANPGEVYVAVTCAAGLTQSALGEGTLWRLNLANKEYTFIRSLKKQMNNLITTRGRAFAAHPENDSLLMVANVQPIYRSTNGGLDFERIGGGQMHDDVHHIVWSPDGKTAWAGHDGGLSWSQDGGLTWEARDNGIGAANVFGLSVAQTREHQVLYGGYDTGGNLLMDEKWYHVSWGDGFETIIDHNDPGRMYATKQHGHIHRSDNGGEKFESSLRSSKTKTDWHTWIRQHPTSPDMVFCSGDKLLRSMNGGDDWQIIFDVDTMAKKHFNVFRFFLSDHHPGVLYAYVLGDPKWEPSIYRTFNVDEEDPSDIEWERVADIPKAGWINSMIIDADNARQFWMAYKQADPEGKVYRFNGERYIDVSANLGWSVVGSMVMDRDSQERLYIGTNHGVFTRNKQEREWTLLEGLPGTWVRSLAINYANGRIYAGTFGRGVWHAPLLGE